jgi:hypothetical protein
MANSERIALTDEERAQWRKHERELTEQAVAQRRSSAGAPLASGRRSAALLCREELVAESVAHLAVAFVGLDSSVAVVLYLAGDNQQPTS